MIIEAMPPSAAGSLNFSSTIASGGTVSITCATITEGNADCEIAEAPVKSQAP